MRIGVHGRQMTAASAPVAAAVLEQMTRKGFKPELRAGFAQWPRSEGLAADLPEFADDGPLPAGLDMIVTLGGDGTLLDAVAMVGSSGVPILGINLGRLGYLSTVRRDGVEAAFTALADGHYYTEKRSLAMLEGGGAGFEGRNFALNEVSVHKRDSSTMLSVHAYLGGRFLNTYWADGLIVATPTGSTAYSLSCGGPLLDPACNSFVITPIAVHNLNVRPFVVPDHHEVKLIVDPRGDKYMVNLDSRTVTLEASTELIIRRAPFDLKLVHFEGHDHLDTLRSKLAWGLDARSTSGPPGTTN